jgi:hypothetical protein
MARSVVCGQPAAPRPTRPPPLRSDGRWSTLTGGVDADLTSHGAHTAALVFSRDYTSGRRTLSIFFFDSTTRSTKAASLRRTVSDCERVRTSHGHERGHRRHAPAEAQHRRAPPRLLFLPLLVGSSREEPRPPPPHQVRKPSTSSPIARLRLWRRCPQGVRSISPAPPALLDSFNF